MADLIKFVFKSKKKTSLIINLKVNKCLQTQ